MVWWQEGQCALALHVSLQRCSAQMAPVCSAGLIRTLASSQIAWIQDLIHVSSVIIALISEVSVFVPKDIPPPTSLHVCSFDFRKINGGDRRDCLWYDRESMTPMFCCVVLIFMSLSSKENTKENMEKVTGKPFKAEWVFNKWKRKGTPQVFLRRWLHRMHVARYRYVETFATCSSSINSES